MSPETVNKINLQKANITIDLVYEMANRMKSDCSKVYEIIGAIDNYHKQVDAAINEYNQRVA